MRRRRRRRRRRNRRRIRRGGDGEGGRSHHNMISEDATDSQYKVRTIEKIGNCNEPNAIE